MRVVVDTDVGDDDICAIALLMLWLARDDWTTPRVPSAAAAATAAAAAAGSSASASGKQEEEEGDAATGVPSDSALADAARLVVSSCEDGEKVRRFALQLQRLWDDAAEAAAGGESDDSYDDEDGVEAGWTPSGSQVWALCRHVAGATQSQAALKEAVLAMGSHSTFAAAILAELENPTSRGPWGELAAMLSVLGIRKALDGAAVLRRLLATPEAPAVVRAAKILAGLPEWAGPKGHSFEEAEWWAECEAVIGAVPDICGLPAATEDDDQGGDAASVGGKAAVDLLAEMVAGPPGPRDLTILAIGPLTNLAAVAARVPVADWVRVDRVVLMGGAVRVPGNNNNKEAEWNFFADPEACRDLLRAFRASQLDDEAHTPELVMCGLEVANENAVARGAQLELVERAGHDIPSDASRSGNAPDPAGRAKRATPSRDLRDVVARSIVASEYSLTFDPVAAAYVTRPDLFQTERLPISCRVDVSDGSEGRTDEHDATKKLDQLPGDVAWVTYATSLNKAAFATYVEDTIRRSG